MERGKFLQSVKGKLETAFFSVVDAVNFVIIMKAKVRKRNLPLR